MELTKKQAISEHRKMWNWIAEETLKQKEIIFEGDYLEKFYPDENIFSNCFCCEYAFQNVISCTNCPINWGNNAESRACIRSESPYCKWIIAGNKADWQQAAILAKEISELPEKQIN